METAANAVRAATEAMQAQFADMGVAAQQAQFQISDATTQVCSGNVQMSVLSNLEMSVSPVVLRAAGGDIGDGAEHERCGAEAARGAAGC